jgi:transcriptional regulator with XRE-family HTH domain
VYLEIGEKAARLRELGLSDRAIANALGVSDKTVAKSLRPIEVQDAPSRLPPHESAQSRRHHT